MVDRKWTRQSVIERIQYIHRQGTPVGHIWRRDHSLCASSYSLFGSWRAALEAAGLQSERQVWSRQRVIDELNAEHSRNLRSRRRQRCDTRIDAAAKRYFGSRHEALAAAGLIKKKPRKTPRRWSASEVIAAIQSRHRQGLSLTTVWRDDVALQSIAKRTFGSWHKASTRTI